MNAQKGTACSGCTRDKRWGAEKPPGTQLSSRSGAGRLSAEALATRGEQDAEARGATQDASESC